jgi:hypothetical protein
MNRTQALACRLVAAAFALALFNTTIVSLKAQAPAAPAAKPAAPAEEEDPMTPQPPPPLPPNGKREPAYGSSFLLQHIFHNVYLRALGVIRIRGKVEQVGVLTRTGCIE